MVGNAHRPRRFSETPKDRESATESIPPEATRLQWRKGEKAGGRKFLNVRAHQQPGDRLARQTPPGARPNKGAGSARPVIDSRVGCSIGQATGRLENRLLAAKSEGNKTRLTGRPAILSRRHTVTRLCSRHSIAR